MIVRVVTVWYRRDDAWQYYYRVFYADGTSFETSAYRPEYFAPGVIQETEK